MKKFARTPRVKSALVLGSLALALSALASSSSYAYDGYGYVCLPQDYGYPNCANPYAYYDDSGFWWPRDHRDFDRHREDGHGHFDHGGTGHGGPGYAVGGHGH